MLEHIKAYYDSQLEASQYSRDYRTKAERIEKYHQLVQKIGKEFATLELIKIYRLVNKSANAIAALATTPNRYRRTIPID